MPLLSETELSWWRQIESKFREPGQVKYLPSGRENNNKDNKYIVTRPTGKKKKKVTTAYIFINVELVHEITLNSKG